MCCRLGRRLSVSATRDENPVTPAGGTTDLSAGGTMVIDVLLHPGAYSLVCRVRDEVDGRPHDEHGMYGQFVVP